MSKHTSGPWEIHEENTIIGPKLDEKSIWLRPIVLQSRTGIKPEDARLIAAAPDLLEALELCDEVMSYMSEYDIPLTLPEKVKTAIAKAKGES